MGGTPALPRMQGHMHAKIFIACNLGGISHTKLATEHIDSYVAMC